MPATLLIHNALIVNENRSFRGSVLIDGETIGAVYEGFVEPQLEWEILDAAGLMLLPGVIDCHVHFREPGLAHKGGIDTESAAAVAGGVTSFMEMPNTIPQTTTLELLEQKTAVAAAASLANYSFFLGATNDNLAEITKADPRKVCGVKVFFGASTGNMLVDSLSSLEAIFEQSPVPVVAHCEDEALIQANAQAMQLQYGDHVPVALHTAIRSAEACYRSAELAVSLARRYKTRLHLAHISTAAELALLNNAVPLSQKRITAETCPHYLLFSDDDYTWADTKLKVNPSVKTVADRKALLQGLIDNRLDIVATDHAPHTAAEKQNSYFKAPSGTPMVQHSLQVMLQLALDNGLGPEWVVAKMCHAPAVCYNIEKRGFIRPGYFADLVLVDSNVPFTVSSSNLLYKCGWSLLEGKTFSHSVITTFVNGNLVFGNGKIDDTRKGQRLIFER